ncbi:MAG: lipoyl(octanoyl) transferase LipB [bacterium]|jgi:lipoyl(octanoyl) transferase|nr:MAG: octanoyltransferase [bacterium]
MGAAAEREARRRAGRWETGPGPRLSPARALHARWLGTVEYGEGLRLQEELVRERRAGSIPDQLLLLEHPHVITLGTSAAPDHVLADDVERRLLGISLFRTGRGGDVTYHGPGQLVGYPILDLKPDRCDLHRYIRDIEEALIRALAGFGITAGRRPGLTGVWVGDEKIAAIGVRVSSGWITSHGFALNVDPDLRYFGTIVPCGIRDYGVTSMARCGVQGLTPRDVAGPVAERFAEVFDRDVFFESGRDAAAGRGGPTDAAQGPGPRAPSSSGGANSKKSR